ncbi:MAG: GNAT family N-acetyltransferase, partial [Firmicutes bacterium]|nr:GNAT family N-acetyltransferase [Bacillota bacterium]
AALRRAKGRLFPFGFIHLLKALQKNDRLDLYLIAVRPDLQGKGVFALIFSEISKAVIRRGFKTAETALMLETNGDVQSLWKYYETRQHKRNRCYIKQLV